MGVGVYKKKLLKVFFVIALLITVISCFLFSSIFYFLNLDSHKTGIRNIAIAKADSLKLSLDVIKDVHKKTEESNLCKRITICCINQKNMLIIILRIVKNN